MTDFDLVARPDPAQIEAARAEIIAFRDAHPTLGNTALAVAFVQQRGSATATELGVLLNLAADEYPSAVLASAVTNGKLVRDGKNWTLGTKAFPDMREPEKLAITRPVTAFPTVAPIAAPTAAPKVKPDALESGGNLGRIQKPLEVPTFIAKPVAATAVSAKPKPSRCRFALWSDGQVEIKMCGLPSVELSSEEVDELIRFVSTANPRRSA